MSAVRIHDVRLELVRPGNPHNQLLSPLTPYMALCGEGSPVTFHIDFEHHQLLTRLERLRYQVETKGKFYRVPERLRQAEVAELGEEVARILAEIRTLSTELARAQGNQSFKPEGGAEAIVHLRLILSGSELSLVPFELAVAPQAYPGEGLEFCLQSSLPIVITREIHRDRPRTPCWNPTMPPKILFVWAAPGTMSVPSSRHLEALRSAVEPWTRRIRNNKPVEGEDRLEFVKQQLRVLPNADIEAISKICSEERFTHVHILAHGATYEDAGVKRFGVALCRKNSPASTEVVSGKKLAAALMAEDDKGSRRSHPLVVTLATCDAGNQSEVLVPGGSIAHDLHSYGIPWVFASQFPLTKRGSVKMAETMYPRLLRGDDPRQMLFELRRQLYVSGKSDHDWGSIVAYASLSQDFENQVAEFCSRQINRAINVSLDYADAVTGGGQDLSENLGDEIEQRKTKEEHDEQASAAAAQVENLLRIWRSRLPDGDSPQERLRRAEITGMHGSTYKRIALLKKKIDSEDGKIADTYDEALKYYRKAMDEAASSSDKYYWTATNYLSLCAVREGDPDRETFGLARALAERDLHSNDRDTQAWANATLAELEMLKEYHTGEPPDERQIVTYCDAVIQLKGPTSFHAGSTRRQFKRYLDHWDDPRWHEIAKLAVKQLTPNGAESEFPEVG